MTNALIFYLFKAESFDLQTINLQTSLSFMFSTKNKAMMNVVINTKSL
jgi:hypothetical protein